MRLTATDEYLRAALHTLEKKLAPELSSSDAQAAAAIMGRVLTELLRREQVSAPPLAASVSLGRDLLAKAHEFAAENEISLSQPDERSHEPASAGFSSLAREHEELCARINRDAAILVDARSQLGQSAQQQLSALLLEIGRWAEAFPRDQRTIALPAAPRPAQPRGAPLDKDLLQKFLRQAHPDGDAVEVLEFKPIPGGFGKQTSRARIREASGEERDLIVRKSDPNPMGLKGAFVIDNEFHLLRDVYKADILPLPEPLWLAKDFPGVDADFYVMSPMPGAIPSSFLGAATASIHEEIILEMAEKMAKLHQLKLGAVADYLNDYDNPAVLQESISDCYRRLIAEWKDYYHENEHLPAPFVVYLLDWLAQNVPDNDATPVVVHGDFNVHNVLVEDGRISAILDWECSNIGAPEQDLAYIRPIISQHIDWDRFIDHYEASGGRNIDRASIDFYMAFAAMRLCVIFNRGVLNMQRGVNDDIRYGIIDLDLTPEFMTQALACTTRLDTN